MAPWNSARTKVQIRLSIQRLRTLQEKKLALAKKYRRDIADLLQKGRAETARLRVEGLIQDDIYVELLELLELYCEKLQARFNLLDGSTGTEPEPSISDAVCAIVYAAPRTELKELHILREYLMHKYGRAFALSLLPTEPAPDTVPPRVTAKLALFTPSADLVDAYLGEIARGYGVPYEPVTSLGPPPEGADLEKVIEKDGESASEDEERPGHGSVGTGDKAPAAIGLDRTSKSPSPDKVDATAAKLGAGPSKTLPAVVAPKVNEEDELAKRFERLKNLR